MTTKTTKVNNAHLAQDLSKTPSAVMHTAIDKKLKGAVNEYIMPASSKAELIKALAGFEAGANELKAIFAKIAEHCFKAGLEKKDAGKAVAKALDAKTVTNLFPEDKERSNRVQAMWHYQADKFWVKPKVEREATISIKVGEHVDMKDVVAKLKDGYTVKQLKELIAQLAGI